MATDLQEISLIRYIGPQGSVELQTCEELTVDRAKPRTRANVMRPSRAPIGWQSGSPEVSLSLTIIPELVSPEVDWVKAWNDDEIFLLAIEFGDGGQIEQFVDCIVTDVSSTNNEAGEARTEVSIDCLVSEQEPAAA